MTLCNFGGFVPLSTIDYPGHACATIFLRGCSVKCPGCHNKHLWEGEDLRDTEDILNMVEVKWVSGIIISGGEPLDQIETIKALADGAHRRGLKVGLHTSGHGKLAEVVDKLDFIMLSRPGNMPWNQTKQQPRDENESK
jgi:pyruvate-formate lyase-activating enzyme